MFFQIIFQNPSLCERAEQLCELLHEQMLSAASEDYGRDVEHVELLMHKFDVFMANLGVNQAKVDFFYLIILFLLFITPILW